MKSAVALYKHLKSHDVKLT